ncbi:MAG: hypothetical protein JSW10_05990 [Pseudomonadota bacterium]|nr:MAG: hypothetical protein JSW10_05990 [Pseudomonadota bacterium]
MHEPLPDTDKDRPYWRNVEAYDFAQILNAAQWAWEFLRRNRDYRTDWQWFDTTWRALEHDYGAPPSRDFFNWKRDPRAWRNPLEIESGQCVEEACAPSQDEQLLIECWMGERWGFHKFPPDPHLSSLQLESSPAWRPHERGSRLLREKNEEYFKPGSGKIALGIDLALPLAEQLDEAKRLVVVMQRRLQKEGALRPASVSSWRRTWIACLRLLDGEQQQASHAELSRSLCSEADHCGFALEELRAVAHRLVERDYRIIAWFTER